MTANSLGAPAHSNEFLATELARIGVAFVATQDGEQTPCPLTPAELLHGLARSDEARLRMSLIPLFIARPDYAVYAGQVADELTGPARVTLICYYTAARLLRDHYGDRLKTGNLNRTPLPDLFGRELNLPKSGDPEWILQLLAQRHADLSGRRLNWYGTYDRAVRGILRQSRPTPV